MPFIANGELSLRAMLDTLEIENKQQLFDEIPERLLLQQEKLADIPEALSEQDVTLLMQQLASQNHKLSCFAGGGSYDHYIPATVWEIASRGEYYSAYTPYQAEASQGTLQLLYEFQSMIAELTAMDVANASLYDGASALAEAALMAVRISRSKHPIKRILCPINVSPQIRQVITTLTQHQQIELELLANPLGSEMTINIDELEDPSEDCIALILPMPNYFGQIEDVHRLCNWAHQHNLKVIAQVNPIALALFEAPGNWGKNGADIVVGEAQPFGISMSAGGPALGIMACKKQYVRQLPGRLVGASIDQHGRRAFTLTLQAREQHIRRSKATSNICTNQGLMAVAATIFMALKGANGLQQVAISCFQKAHQFRQQLAQIKAIQVLYSNSFFHEFVIRLPNKANIFIEQMSQQGILAGISLADYGDEYSNDLLICVTEKRSTQELQDYIEKTQLILSQFGESA